MSSVFNRVLIGDVVVYRLADGSAMSGTVKAVNCEDGELLVWSRDREDVVLADELLERVEA